MSRSDQDISSGERLEVRPGGSGDWDPPSLSSLSHVSNSSTSTSTEIKIIEDLALENI